MNLFKQHIYKCNHKSLLQVKPIQTLDLFSFIYQKQYETSCFDKKDANLKGLEQKKKYNVIMNNKLLKK